MKLNHIEREIGETDVDQTLAAYLGQLVVLDTAGQIVYLGSLAEIVDSGFWLENADVHDCRDGHAGKEAYVLEAKLDGIRSNRRRLFVMRCAVISISALGEVVGEDLDPKRETIV